VIVLEVFVRLVVVATSFVDFVTRRTGFSGAFDDDPRRSVWRDNTVASEHVDVDRTACLTDSDIDLGGKTVTAMAHRGVGGRAFTVGLDCGRESGLQIEALLISPARTAKTAVLS
jgi:hypothetical protein